MKRRGPICSGEQQTRQADVNKQGLAITTRTGAMPRMFTRRRFWLPALVLVAAGSVLACFALQRRVTLREMLQVQMGMGKLEVQQILGRPDIIELESMTTRNGGVLNGSRDPYLHPSIARGKGAQKKRCRCRRSQIAVQRLGRAEQRNLFGPVLDRHSELGQQAGLHVRLC